MRFPYPLHRCLRWVTLPSLILAILWIGMASAAERRFNPTLEIHTVLPFDGIPAIFIPEFVSAEGADIHSDSPVIGVSLGGEQHAYSMLLLNGHEIVNDTVGNEPIATTW